MHVGDQEVEGVRSEVERRDAHLESSIARAPPT
jgi:hypothetical protein